MDDPVRFRRHHQPAGRDRHAAAASRHAGLGRPGRGLGARRDRFARVHERPGGAAGHERGRAARGAGAGPCRSGLCPLRRPCPPARHRRAGGQRRAGLRHPGHPGARGHGRSAHRGQPAAAGRAAPLEAGNALVAAGLRQRQLQVRPARRAASRGQARAVRGRRQLGLLRLGQGRARAGQRPSCWITAAPTASCIPPSSTSTRRCRACP